MAYGTIKVDTITFTDAGVDKSVTISGLVQNPTFSGNITVTGTVSGNTIRGQTVSGATITGGAAAFTTVTGGVATITSGVFALGSASNPSISFTGDANSGLYSPGADQVAISTNGTGRLFVDASGNVDIASSLQALTLLNLNASTTGNAAIRFSDTTANIGNINYNFTDDALTFRVNASERLRITSAGLVGIGTSSPQVLLDVWETSTTAYSSSATTAKATVRFNNNADGGYGSIILNALNGSISGVAQNCQASINCVPEGLNTRNTSLTFGVRRASDGQSPEVVRIDSSGRVGIGVTAPQSLLHVQHSSDGEIARFQRSGGTNIPILRLNLTESTKTAEFEYTGTDANGNIAFKSGGSERARIDSSGRLLVGTSSGVSAAFVNSSIQAHGLTGDASSVTLYRFTTSATAAASPRLVMARSGSDSKDFTVVANGNRLGQFNFVGADGTQFVSAASIDCEVDGTPGLNDMPGRLVFSTTFDGAASPTERMRITNSGEVLVGKQTADNTTVGLRLAPDFASFVRDGNIALLLNRLNSDGNIADFRRSGTVVGSISVTTTATAYNTSSDYRLKENVTAVTDGITRLQQLKPSRFNFIADAGKTVDGFIAHEVQTIVPEAITGEKDAVDDDGNPVYQGIDQSKLVPLLTAALQEAVARIEQLEATVATLQGS